MTTYYVQRYVQAVFLSQRVSLIAFEWPYVLHSTPTWTGMNWPQ